MRRLCTYVSKDGTCMVATQTSCQYQGVNDECVRGVQVNTDRTTKGIVVAGMAMPASCTECNFWRMMEDDKENVCVATQRTNRITNITGESKPIWCPLRSIEFEE